MPVRVLIVDDSVLERQMLHEILASDPEIEVVGDAPDPYVAKEKIKQLQPDVITLDVEMPRMNGIAFLENLMRFRPMPVVMISSLTEKGGEVTLRALELGAIDYIPKGKLTHKDDLKVYAEDIQGKVKMAAQARVRTLADRKPISREVRKQRPTGGLQKFRSSEVIIGLGASTGGTEAIAEVLSYLPTNMPGIVVTQHIMDNFSRSFVRHLNDRTFLTVVEANDGQQIIPGHVYLAPGTKHLTVVREGMQYICRLDDGPQRNRHKPSVDVMFESLARNAGAKAIGVIMTGMGTDGTIGMDEMKKSGAATIAQDEKSSVIWGMPGSAINQGCVDEVISLPDIAHRLIALCS